MNLNDVIICHKLSLVLRGWDFVGFANVIGDFNNNLWVSFIFFVSPMICHIQKR
jgi:hypothetical protein